MDDGSLMDRYLMLIFDPSEMGVDSYKNLHGILGKVGELLFLPNQVIDAE